MIYKLLLAELKLIFRNRLALLYFLLSPITLIFCLYFLFSRPEDNESYSIFNLVYLLPFTSFMGSGIFCWYWGRLNYKFFFLKRTLEKLLISKIIFVYIIQSISIFASTILFLYFEYYYYLKIIIFSSINSLVFFTLLILWILSYDDDTIDLFDNQVFIIKQNIINIASLILIMMLSALSYYTFNLYPFLKLSALFLFINVILVFFFKSKIMFLIKKQLINNSKIKINNG